MAKVSMLDRLGVGAQKVWDMVGNFNGMADWHPAFERSEIEDGGKRRRLTPAAGGQIYEQLESRDDAADPIRRPWRAPSDAAGRVG